MVTLALMLKVLALVLFLVAIPPIGARWNLLAAGLAAWVLSTMVP